MRIDCVRDLIRALRAGPYTWPGGYPQFFITSDGAALSFKAVRANVMQVARAVRDSSRDGWRVVAVDVNWENPDLYCDDTNERIESAYAEPEPEVSVGP